MVGIGSTTGSSAKQPPYVVAVVRKYFSKPLEILGKTYNALPIYWAEEDRGTFNYLPVNGALWILKNEMPDVLSSTKEPLNTVLYVDRVGLPSVVSRTEYYLIAYRVSKITCKATVESVSENVGSVVLKAGEREVKLTSTYPDYQDVSIQFDRPQNISIYVRASPDLSQSTGDYFINVFMTGWKFE